MNYDLFSEITVDYAVIIIITCLNGRLQTQIHSIRRWTGWLRANYLKVFNIRSIKLVLPYQHDKKKIVLFYTNMRRYWFPLEMKANISVFKKISWVDLPYCAITSVDLFIENGYLCKLKGKQFIDSFNIWKEYRKQ